MPVTFAWSGDLGGQGRCRRGAAGYPIFDVMRAQQLDFFLVSRRYDVRLTTCARRLRTSRALTFWRRPWPSTVPVIVTNGVRRRCGGFLDSVPVYVSGTIMKCGITFPGLSTSRMPVGRQALREYWPIRVAADDPQRLYRTVRAGADLEMFILDTRQYRSRNADQDGPAKTMLGETATSMVVTRAYRVICDMESDCDHGAAVNFERRSAQRPWERWLGRRAGMAPGLNESGR